MPGFSSPYFFLLFAIYLCLVQMLYYFFQNVFAYEFIECTIENNDNLRNTVSTTKENQCNLYKALKGRDGGVDKVEAIDLFGKFYFFL